MIFHNNELQFYTTKKNELSSLADDKRKSIGETMQQALDFGNFSLATSLVEKKLEVFCFRPDISPVNKLDDFYFYCYKHKNYQLANLILNTSVKEKETTEDFEIGELISLSMMELGALDCYIKNGTTEVTKLDRCRLVPLIVKVAQQEGISLVESDYSHLLRKLPDSFYTYIRDKRILTSELSTTFRTFLVNLTQNNVQPVLDYLSNKEREITKDLPSSFYNLLLTDAFWQIGDYRQETLLEDLYGFQSEEEEKCHFIKTNYLLGDCPNHRLSFEQFNIINDFLKSEGSPSLMASKIKALRRISSQLEAKEIKEEVLESYLAYLTHYSKEDQAHQIAVRSAYFKNHSVTKFYKIVNDSPHKEQYDLLLSQDVKKKQQKIHYQTITLLQGYDQSVVEQVINKLKDVQTVKRAKEIRNIIKSDTFREATAEKQQVLLTALPGENTYLQNEDFSVRIPDAEYLKKILPTPECKAKIMIAGEEAKIYIKKKNTSKAT